MIVLGGGGLVSIIVHACNISNYLVLVLDQNEGIIHMQLCSLAISHTHTHTYQFKMNIVIAYCILHMHNISFLNATFAS